MMKLSEAMRRGARHRPQSTNGWVDDNGGECALVSAMRGVGLSYEQWGPMATTGLLIEVFPNLYNRVECTACNHQAFLYNMIIHMNDVHNWSRERIAGWIEAHVEVPTYTMLQIQEYIGEPVQEMAVVPRMQVERYERYWANPLVKVFVSQEID